MAALEVIGGNKGESTAPTRSLFLVRYRNSKKELVPKKVVATSIEEALETVKKHFSHEIVKLITVEDQEESVIV